MALLGRPSAKDDERAEAWRDWIQSRNPLAIASLVLGIFSLIEFGALLVFGIGSIVLGILALRQLRDAAGRAPSDDAPPPRFGHRLAWTGIALATVSLVIAAVLLARRHPF